MEELNFPIVTATQNRLIADDIEPLTAEQVREGLKEIFAKLEEITGYEVTVVGESLPTRIFVEKNK